MISDNDKNKLKDIKKGLNSIEANLDNLSFVYKTASNLFRLCDKLEDNNLKANIKGELAQINQMQYKEEIQQAIVTIFAFISRTEEKKSVEKSYLQYSSIEKTEDYKEDCKKYLAYKKNIDEIEKKVLNSPSYQKKLHELLKYNKKWPEHLHARLTDNLRIIYFYDKDTKEIIFKRIITHDELDKN